MLRLKKFILPLTIFGSLILLLTLFCNLTILSYKKDIIAFTEASAPIAIVFGGGMLENGEQTPMQKDRVDTGIALYKAGNVQKIFITGDDGTSKFNEVDAMKAHVLSSGVPEEAIIVDGSSFRTYESCYRAKHVYGIDHAVGVSQWFHLPRILYFCQELGIDIVGVSSDNQDYGFHIYRMHARDVLARVKGWWQIEISKPLPTII